MLSEQGVKHSLIMYVPSAGKGQRSFVRWWTSMYSGALIGLGYIAPFLFRQRSPLFTVSPHHHFLRLLTLPLIEELWPPLFHRRERCSSPEVIWSSIPRTPASSSQHHLGSTLSSLIRRQLYRQSPTVFKYDRHNLLRLRGSIMSVARIRQVGLE